MSGRGVPGELTGSCLRDDLRGAILCLEQLAQGGWCSPTGKSWLVAVSLTAKVAKVDQNAPAWEPTWGSSMAAAEIVALVPRNMQLATKVIANVMVPRSASLSKMTFFIAHPKKTSETNAVQQARVSTLRPERPRSVRRRLAARAKHSPSCCSRGSTLGGYENE